MNYIIEKIVYADKINDKQLLEREMNNLRKYLLK